MAEIRHEVTIERAADEVWKVVGNFADLSWFPGVADLTVEGERRFIPFGEQKIVEELTRRDDDARELTYGIVEAPFPVEAHRATWRVEPAGAGSARVTVDVEVVPDDLGIVMDATYSAAVEGLRNTLEA